MDIYEKIVKLLVASGNVSEEKVEQARKLAESLVWDGEVRPTQRAADVLEVCDNFKKARDGRCFNCGHAESAHR